MNIAAAFEQITDFYQPKVVGELNGQVVRLVRAKGPLAFHHHEHEDEMFLIFRGQFRMEFRDRMVTVNPGEFIIVPRGVEHRPFPEDEAWVMLFEPLATRQTGDNS